METKLIELSERDYRKLPYVSYSSLKDFITSPMRFYKKHILHERINEIDNQKNDNIRMGNLVDCLLSCADEFDERYIITIAKKPDGLMGTFVDFLYKETVTNTNDQGIFCGNLENLIDNCYTKTGFVRDKLDKVKEKFLVEKIGWDYYCELTQKGDRVIVEPSEVEWANNIVDWLKTHPFSRNYIDVQSGGKYIVYNQLMITCVINGITCKMMIDKLILNTETKIATPIDYKCTGTVTMFPYNFLKLGYWLQMGIYTTGLREHFPDYKVLPLSFLIFDKYMQEVPTFVKINEKQYTEAMEGFTTIYGRKYNGLLQILEEYKWHEDKEIWNTTKQVYENNGVVELDLINFENEE